MASAQPNEDLPRDHRPVADLVLLSQMLAVGRIDSGGNVVPLQLHDLTEAWQILREKYPHQFAATSSDVLAWHRREAEQSEIEGNLAAALFHLDRALDRQSEDAVLRRERSEMAAVLAQGTNNGRYRASDLRRIPPRDPSAGAEQIDLSAHYNLRLQTSLTQTTPDQNNFANLPSGLQTFGGARFDVRGLIHLNGLGAQREGLIFPESRKGIRIGRKCQRLHFLHAAAWDAEDGTQIGAYVLHYADGQRLELPIVSGRDLGDYWFWGVPTGPNEPGGALIVWTGTNPGVAAANNTAIRLYKSARENPRPGVELVSIDFISSMSLASPFLVALTVE